MAEKPGSDEQQALMQRHRKTVASVNHQLADVTRYDTFEELARHRSGTPSTETFLLPVPDMVAGMGCPPVGVQYVKIRALPSWIMDTVAQFGRNTSNNLDTACEGFDPDGHKEGPAHTLPKFFWAGQVAAYLRKPSVRGIVGMSDYNVNFAVANRDHEHFTQVDWFTAAVWNRQWAVAHAVYPRMVACVSGEFARLSHLCSEERTVYQMTVQVSFPTGNEQLLMIGKIAFTEDGASLSFEEDSACALMDVRVLLGCALRTGKVAGRVLPSSVTKDFVAEYVERHIAGEPDEQMQGVYEHFEAGDQNFVELVMGKPAERQKDARVVQLYEERPFVEWMMSMDGRNPLRRMPHMYPTDVSAIESMVRW